MTKTKPIVAPHPPRFDKSINPKLNTLGIAFPASNAAVFSAIYPNQIGIIAANTVVDP